MSTSRVHSPYERTGAGENARSTQTLELAFDLLCDELRLRRCVRRSQEPATIPRFCNCRSGPTAFAYLLAPHRVVQTLAVDQLFVASEFDDMALFQNIDSIGVQHR